MNCPNCQHTNPPDVQFCNNCGEKQQPTCSQCGKENPAGSRFCNGCGNRLLPTVGRVESDGVTGSHPVTAATPKAAERRQLTCLFCDLQLLGTSLTQEKDVHKILN